METLLVFLGVGIVFFVAFNIGGSTIGPAFGPAIGSNALRKSTAAGFMSVFFFLGAATIGRRVVDTLGRDLVQDPGVLTLQASLVVLFFIGLALFWGNYAGVPASTSMTAVGAIGGLGFATNTLNWGVVGEIMVWWVVAPVIAFWISLLIGRYFYSYINRQFALATLDEPALRIKLWYGIPLPSFPESTDGTQATGVLTVLGIGCLMAFSSGTSNIANAIAPLVGSGTLPMNAGILLGSMAVAVGCFTIGRRTLDTLGNDITELPLTAAVIVASVSATIVILLSAIGIPASFVVVATLSIVGLGWGRATRSMTMEQALATKGESSTLSVNALTIDAGGEHLPAIGDEETHAVPDADELFEPGTTARVVVMQNIVPILATGASYFTFRFLF